MHFSFSHTTSLRVRYAETDKMGYCYYGNYAQYLEVGRVEAMRFIGVSYRELEEKGIMMPVLDFSIHYNKPIKYDDKIEIVTFIKEISGVRMFFEYEVYNEEKQIVAKAKTTLVFVNSKTMNPIKAPLHFFSRLKEFQEN